MMRMHTYMQAACLPAVSHPTPPTHPAPRQVFDALERAHQCATIQLDFQLPIRFRLKYQCKPTAGAAKDKDKDGEEAAAEAPAPAAKEEAAPAGPVMEEGAEEDKGALVGRSIIVLWNALIADADVRPIRFTTRSMQPTTWTRATSGPSSCTAPCWAPWSA